MARKKANRANCINAVMMDDRLYGAHESAVKDIRFAYHEDLEAMAGYLLMSGFLDATMLICAGEQNKPAFVQVRTQDAVKELESVGLLAIPGWWSIGWFVFKWIVLPYLQRLLTLWVEQAESGAVGAVK